MGELRTGSMTAAERLVRRMEAELGKLDREEFLAMALAIEPTIYMWPTEVTEGVLRKTWTRHAVRDAMTRGTVE